MRAGEFDQRPKAPPRLGEASLAAARLAASAGIRAAVLTGSWARQQADASSDVDVVVLGDGPGRALQVGWFDGHLVEVLYLAASQLSRWPVTRATMAGARPLYDPDGLAGEWLASIAERLAHPPTWATELAYGRFELTQTLRILEWVASRGPDTLVLLRGQFVADLTAYRLRQRGVWAPTLRRQLRAVADHDPDAHAWIAACLRAHEPADIVARCQAAWAALAGPGPGLEPLGQAPRWPLDP